MAATSSAKGKPRLRLDIATASKANEAQPKIWTTQQEKIELEDIASTNTAENKDKDAYANGKAEKLSSSSNSIGKNAKENGDMQLDQAKPQDKKKGKLESQKSKGELTFSQRYFSWRYIMMLLLQSSWVVVIFYRNCLPMAMVCMVSSKSSTSSSSSLQKSWFNGTMNGTSTPGGMIGVQANVHGFGNGSLLLSNGTGEEEHMYEFDWDSDVQGLVLSSVGFSSFLGPLLVEPFRNRLGNKLTLTLCNLLSTLIILLSPVATRISPYLLVALRVALGIIMGGNVPVIGDCLAWWAPQLEKLTMMALTFTGINIGGILISLLSGFLCSVPIDNGWPFIFYTFGALGLVWGALWHFFSAPKPEDHPFISEKEREYIVSHRVGMEQAAGGKPEKPPYMKMLTSVPLIAFICAIMCHVWSANLFFTYLPTYFSRVLAFPVHETGILVSVVSVFRMLGSFLWTVVSNKLVTVVEISSARKICVIIGFTVAGCCQIGMGFFDANTRWVAFALFLVVMIGQSVGTSVLTAIPLDMAPRYAGLLTGVFVSVGSLVGISGPLLTAALTPNNTAEEWRTVWIIVGSVFMAGGAIFIIFGKASLQPWAQVNRTSLPHIVSPFVKMGRRFSAFMEAPPLSPVTARSNKRFDFTVAIHASATSVFPNIGATTPSVAAMSDVRAPDFLRSVVGNDEQRSKNDEQSYNDELNDGFENKAFEEDQAYGISKIKGILAFKPEMVNQKIDFEDDVKRRPTEEEGGASSLQDVLPSQNRENARESPDENIVTDSENLKSGAQMLEYVSEHSDNTKL